MFRITAVLVKTLRERTGAGIMECKKALVETNGNIELAIDNMRKFSQSKATKRAARVTSAGIILMKVFGNSKFGALLELNCETDFAAKNATFLAFSNEVLKAVVLNRSLNIDELRAQFEEQRRIIVNKIGENINIRRVGILEGERIGSYLHGVRIGVLVSAEGADDALIKHIAMHIAASKPEYLTPADVPIDLVAHEHQIQLDIAMQSIDKSPEILEKVVTGRMNKFTAELSLMGQQFIMDPKKTVSVLLKEKNAKIINFIRFELGESIKSSN